MAARPSKQEMEERVKILMDPRKTFFEIEDNKQLFRWYDEIMQCMDLMINPPDELAAKGTIHISHVREYKLNCYNYQIMRPKYASSPEYSMNYFIIPPLSTKDADGWHPFGKYITYGNKPRQDSPAVMLSDPKNLEQCKKFERERHSQPFWMMEKDGIKLVSLKMWSLATGMNLSRIITVLVVKDEKIAYEQYLEDMHEICLKHIECDIAQLPLYDEVKCVKPGSQMP